MHPTGGTLRVFKHFAWLEVSSGKVALYRPTHQRVSREDHTGQAASRWAANNGIRLNLIAIESWLQDNRSVVLKLKKVIFILLPILLVPLGAVIGGYIGLRSAANNIHSQEDWRRLSVPPAQVVQILGFCERQLCVKTADGKQYQYTAIDCNQSANKSCWSEVTAAEIEPTIPHLSNPCMYEFQIPSPPPDTIQMLGVKACGSGGDYYESYALLEDGSVWKWDHSISDLAPLGMINGLILGVSLGLFAGLLIAIAVFFAGRVHRSRLSSAIEIDN